MVARRGALQATSNVGIVFRFGIFVVVTVECCKVVHIAPDDDKFVALARGGRDH